MLLNQQLCNSRLQQHLAFGHKPMSWIVLANLNKEGSVNLRAAVHVMVYVNDKNFKGLDINS